MANEIPVYLFVGFLESGKTKFIQETLEDERFNAGERTLLLVFEEGEEEYDFSTYPHKNVYLETLDQQTVTTKELQALAKKYKAQRVVAELNGMQQVMGAVSNIGQGFAKGGLIGGIGAAIGEAANFLTSAFAAEARHKDVPRRLRSARVRK